MCSEQLKFFKNLSDYSFPKHWQHYGSYFRVEFIKLFLIWFLTVPLFVAMLQKSDLPLQVELPGSYSVITLELPFRWEALWVASILYFIALLMYLLRCPAFIKMYSSYSEFLSLGHSNRNIVWEAYRAHKARGREKFLKDLIEKGFAVEHDKTVDVDTDLPVSKKDRTEWKFSINERYYCLARNVVESNDGMEVELFWIVFAEYAGAHLISRLIIEILIFLAELVILIVIFQSIYTVLQYSSLNWFEWFYAWMSP